MSPFELALFCGVIGAAAVSWGNYRAWLWLGFGTADYILTSVYYAAGLPQHAFFTAMVDASVCGAIYLVCKRFGGHRWELPLFTAFQFSVLVSFTRLAGLANSYSYAVLLEAANWAAIICIFGAGTAGLADAYMDRTGHRRDHLRRLVSSLSAPVKVHTFWFLGSRGGSPAAR